VGPALALVSMTPDTTDVLPIFGALERSGVVARSFRRGP
jgi:hypothetical protein